MSYLAADDAQAEPNLTPILDMVFQLITFFMLVINFKANELDLRLHLPVIGSARPVAGGGNILVLNIHGQEGQTSLVIFGRSIPEDQITGFLANEARASLLAAGLTPDDLRAGQRLPDLVVLRADRQTPAASICRVLAACQEQGFGKFAFRTAGAP